MYNFVVTALKIASTCIDCYTFYGKTLISMGIDEIKDR